MALCAGSKRYVTNTVLYARRTQYVPEERVPVFDDVLMNVFVEEKGHVVLSNVISMKQTLTFDEPYPTCNLKKHCTKLHRPKIEST